MTDEVYDNSCKKHVNLTFSEDLIRLNEEFDDHMDKLQAMIAVAQTNENFNDQSKLVFHSYFCLMENEMQRLGEIKNKLFASLHHLQ